jgi:hypothetical protein
MKPVPGLSLVSVVFLTACPLWAQEPAAARQPELPPISPNRPTFSDSTVLVPAGHLQVETGYTFTRRTEAGADAQRSNFPEVVLRYGISDRLEVRAVWGGYAWSEVDAGGGGASRDDGGTDPGLAILVPVTDQQGLVPAVTLEAATTFGVGSESFSSGHADPTLKLLWSYCGDRLPEWLGVGGNLIASFPTENGDRFTQTAASLWTTWSAAGGDTSVFAEWFVVSEPANNVESTQSVGFGVVQRLSNTVAVDARVGFGLDDRADDFFTGIGISFLF